jgi:transposase
LKPRILIKADQGEAGEGWADEEIARALDTNVTMVARVREMLVLGRCRRLAKDYENLTRSHVGFIILAMIRLMLRRIVTLQGAS